MPKVPRRCLHKVPREFFCPISQEFIKDPVKSPSTNRTYNRNSLVAVREGTLEINGDNDILPPENESVLPDHKFRRTIAAWRRFYKLMPPFSFISRPADLEAAVDTLLDRQQHQLSDRKLLRFLRELSSVIEGKPAIVNSREGFLLFSKLIAGCPVDSISNSVKWVRYSVRMLATADNFNNEVDLGVDLEQTLAVVDRDCAGIDDADFQLGLVNLIYPIMASKEQIINHRGIVRALSSYILRPDHGHISKSKIYFDKLFSIIMELWGTEGSFEHPRLSQAVASLVWPMHAKIDGGQYNFLLRTISTRLDTRFEGQTPLSSLPAPVETLTRSGLVSRIFGVLAYATLPADTKLSNPDGWLQRGELTSPLAEEIVVMRCFEMLQDLSTDSIARLEIVRVIRRSGYMHILSFYTALLRYTLPRQKESHVLPALFMIFNVLINTRYLPLLGTVIHSQYDVFSRFVTDDHPIVREVAEHITNLYDKIIGEEEDPPLIDF